MLEDLQYMCKRFEQGHFCPCSSLVGRGFEKIKQRGEKMYGEETELGMKNDVFTLVFIASVLEGSE